MLTLTWGIWSTSKIQVSWVYVLMGYSKNRTLAAFVDLPGMVTVIRELKLC